MYVCLGNICRSPAAEAILRKLAEGEGMGDKISIESSGLGAWYVGHQADHRMRSAAQNRGISLVGRAKQFLRSDFDTFDYILAADHEVYNELINHAATIEQKVKIQMITSYSDNYKGMPVPDPYYNGAGAFEEVLDILEDSCEGFLRYLKNKP